MDILRKAGNMNISAITKGFILPSFTYEIRRVRHGGGSSYGVGYDDLQKDLQKFSGVTEDDYDIFIFVDWDKKIDKDIKVYAELIEKKIRVELIPFDKDKKIKITVELKKE